MNNELCNRKINLALVVNTVTGVMYNRLAERYDCIIDIDGLNDIDRDCRIIECIVNKALSISMTYRLDIAYRISMKDDQSIVQLVPVVTNTMTGNKLSIQQCERVDIPASEVYLTICEQLSNID